jgi:SNF2 family DNA or RNA helicase
MTKQLHDYQRKAVEYIKEKRRCGLFLDLGLGKTVTTLTAISEILAAGGAKKVLVIAPLRVASTVWDSEVAEWDHLKHLKVSKVLGTPAKRIKGLEAKADIYLINRENISWLETQTEHFKTFDFLVIDESSSFKDGCTKRHKSLRPLAKLVKYCVLLSATPAPNSFLDLFYQLYLIDSGQALGWSFVKFREKYCYSDRLGYNWTPKEGSAAEVRRLVSHKCLSMQAADYLTMPDLININSYVELPSTALRAYKSLERSLFLDLGNDKAINPSSSAVLANKLLQVANGAVYRDCDLDCDTLKQYEILHDAKIEALQELIETNDEPMLVCYNYRSDLERLRIAFPSAEVFTKDSADTVSRWNDGKIKMLLVHPASAGHGLNLQRGGSLIVFFSLIWSLELYQQVIGRLYRQGQEKPVRIIHLLARDTIDERISTVLSSRGANQAELVNALKYKG